MESKNPQPSLRVFVDLIPAASYSPTQFPMQYHRLRRT